MKIFVKNNTQEEFIIDNINERDKEITLSPHKKLSFEDFIKNFKPKNSIWKIKTLTISFYKHYEKMVYESQETFYIDNERKKEAYYKDIRENRPLILNGFVFTAQKINRISIWENDIFEKLINGGDE